MLTKSKRAFILIIFALAARVGFPENRIEIIQKNQVEIGKNSLLFASIASVCEDAEERIYVLDRILLSPDYVFVFRGRKDITDETSSIPVDIFSLQGRFLGYAEMNEEPILISQERMYFVRTDSEDNLF